MIEIPGYRIEGLIAEGGMATVYRALQESLQRPVAIKVLRHATEPQFRERFLAEGRLVAALRHPGIITLHDLGFSDGHPYLVMELVGGGDLEARIGAGLSPEQALAILRRLAETLAYVHAQGVVHRDIKPGNVLFRQPDESLLGDFGIAKQLDGDLKRTRDDLTLGTPYYLSPEQCQGEALDGRADLYSLGILMFEMLNKRPPFRGKSAQEVMLRHLRDPLPALKRPLRRFQPLLEQMTAKDPGQRPADCAALLRLLDEQAATLAAPPPPTPRRTPKAAKTPVEDKASVLSVTAPTLRWPLRPGWTAALIFVLFLLLDGPHHLLVLAGLTRPGQPAGPLIQWVRSVGTPVTPEPTRP